MSREQLEAAIGAKRWLHDRLAGARLRPLSRQAFDEPNTTAAKQKYPPPRAHARHHLGLYYYMRLNRALEDQMVRLFRQNKIVGGLYSSLGQEGISVGTAYALEKRDWMAPMIRNIGALLVKGCKPREFSRSTWRNTRRRRWAKTAPAISAI